MIRVGIMAAVLVLAGCASSTSGSSPAHSPVSSAPPRPTVATVRGTVVVAGKFTIRNDNQAYTQCWTMGNSPIVPSRTPFDAVKRGAQVVLTDASGRTVGIGTVSIGETHVDVPSGTGHPDCFFSFRVPGVPLAGQFFGVRIGSVSREVAASDLPRLTVRLP